MRRPASQNYLKMGKSKRRRKINSKPTRRQRRGKIITQMKVEQRKSKDIIERAFCAGLEVRNASDGTGPVVLRGYAAKFDSVYSMGWYTEEVARTAFDNADMTDVRILFNHDSNQILGRTKSGTARVGVDENGLWYEVDLPESAAALREAIQRGDIDQSSWGFMLRNTSESDGEEWGRRNGRPHRILKDVSVVFDASPVTFPANPDTSVHKRQRYNAYLKRAGEEDLPELTDIQSEIFAASSDCVECLNETVFECGEFAMEAENYAAIDPGNADLYRQAAANCQATADAAKAAIETHLQIMAALNGQRSAKPNVNKARLLDMDLRLAELAMQ